MYHFSRAMYRELAQDIGGDAGRQGHEAVLRACERCVERLATDRAYFAHPTRTLFNDIRAHFPMSAQMRVWRVVCAYVAAADASLSRREVSERCRGTTRRGTPCLRDPLPETGYCPSHRHLAETEHAPAIAA